MNVRKRLQPSCGTRGKGASCTEESIGADRESGQFHESWREGIRSQEENKVKKLGSSRHARLGTSNGATLDEFASVTRPPIRLSTGCASSADECRKLAGKIRPAVVILSQWRNLAPKSTLFLSSSSA